MNRKELVLAIALSDSTFNKKDVRGSTAWVGKCIHCNAKLVVALDGGASPDVTVEHILPRTHGGTDALENVALACARCNHEKGVRHDPQKKTDARMNEVVKALLEKRRARMREPDEA
jgi:5-methylcytosine-specific restriction endonuclease McrA